ncbi:NTF2-related export protein 1-like [Dendronephthya gigantea]|uniref:NTF2-related export protein 1-like n=1 Tax=Dendronephthya gigantea TaxID=151771 RepID=UPI00106A97F3|nr:NTF2-related export protein 1-like [Dendronephthya gigantea]
MAASKQENKKLLAEQASKSGEEFIQLYYETFDKRRHVLSKLYSDTSSLVWNGHHIKGSDKLNEFLVSLPTTVHNIYSMDCQPVPEKAVPGGRTIAVFVSGNVEYEDTKAKIFSQNFVLTAEGKVWKVVSDCFRTTT